MSSCAPVSDRALVDRVLAGDVRAADAFVTRFARLVWWILLHQAKLPRESAEDVYQDVFSNLWTDGYRRLRTWSGDGDLATWLAPVVRNVAVDRLRRDGKLCERQVDSDPDGPAAAGRADPASDPEALAAVEEQRRLLFQALGSLDDNGRILYRLRFIEGHSYRDIATTLAITVNNVGVRVSRLVDSLRAAVFDGPAGKTGTCGGDVRLSPESTSPG